MSPRRGSTRAGRARAKFQSKAAQRRPTPPLLKGEDYGQPIRVTARDVRARPDNWVEPFLAANRRHLARLDLQPTVETQDGVVSIGLRPSARIGAVPLLAPSDRRVAAGLIITPRFGWTSAGQVLGRLGFSVEPQIGGGPLVPGSAREVPPWILAGPVITRIEQLLHRMTRGFELVDDVRTSPRGSIDWNRYAQTSLPSGQWGRIPCRYPELQDDRHLLAQLRWTSSRVRHDLERSSDTTVGRVLLDRIDAIDRRVGAGPRERPADIAAPGLSSSWLQEAIEAMQWVSEERGLGGSRELDGLTWSLKTDELWEAWVEQFVLELGPRLGAVAVPRGRSRIPLDWRSAGRSLGHLAPDLALRRANRTIWIDAKYKWHLVHLHQGDWQSSQSNWKESHRADVHQALAYASLADTETVDTVLAYPWPTDGSGSVDPPISIAHIPAGRRRVRLILAGLPFGFRGNDLERSLEAWRAVLAA